MARLHQFANLAKKLCSKLLSEELDDKFDGKHINIMQRLALYFQLFILLFSPSLWRWLRLPHHEQNSHG